MPDHRVLVGLGCALVGCVDVSSDDVLTDGMYANLTVTADGGGTSVADAVLRVGGALSNTYVDLAPGDELYASIDGGEPELMTEYELLDYHGYSTTFQSADPASVYTIAFVRTIDDGAPESTIRLPEPFEVGPVPDTFSRSEDDLTITWVDGGDYPIEITVSGDCIDLYTDTTEGALLEWTAPAGTFEPLEGHETESCSLTVVLRLLRDGALDGGYGEGGSASGVQKRTTSVESTP